MTRRNILVTLTVLVSLFFLSGCMEDLGIVRNIKPDQIKHYDLQGTFVYGAVKTKPTTSIERVMIYFKNGPDINLQLNNSYEPFLLDMPFTTQGISRFGFVYTDSDGEKKQWIEKEIPFTIVSNKINYIGVFFFTEPDSFAPGKLTMTNYLEADKADCYSNYTQLTHYEFYPVELKK